jgi:uncharacterized membrane protein affecting hemolysin expression
MCLLSTTGSVDQVRLRSHKVVVRTLGFVTLPTSKHKHTRGRKEKGTKGTVHATTGRGDIAFILIVIANTLVYYERTSKEQRANNGETKQNKTKQNKTKQNKETNSTLCEQHTCIFNN